ncbi:MAG: phosphodiester glycosidase family protein [Tissierellia bacterium]|nr:phosphodiester glycosidase family protein [Tissierellia bacterium]
MKNKLLQSKSLLVIVLVLTLLFPTISEAALPTTVFQRNEVEQISSGTTVEHIQRFTTSGWLNIHVVRTDLNNPTQKPVTIFGNEGMSVRKTVNSMVDSNQGVIAAVNGDYFNYKPMPSTLGVMVSDGNMISSPPHMEYALPAFYVDVNNKGHVGYLDRTITVTNNRTGASYPINMVNKISADYTTIALLDSSWGANSPGNKTGVAGIREVVIVGDKVTEVRDNAAGVAIPKDGYVLAVKAEKLADIQVGDSITLKKDIIPTTGEVPFAIGGGSIILKNGEITRTNVHSQGVHPRTGIGVNQEGSSLIMVTVDGRGKSYKGLEQDDFAALMKELGAWNALNLDGGGSTTLAVSPRDGNPSKVLNSPSEGSPRPVVNSVGIRSTDAVGELSYLKVSSNAKGVHAGNSISMKVTGYDVNHHVIPVDSNSVNLEIAGVEGTSAGIVFTPSTSGQATITARVGNASGTMTLPVYGPISALQTIGGITLEPGGRKTITVSGVDARGYSATLPVGTLAITVNGAIGRMEGSDFIAGGEAATGYISVSHGAIVKNIPVTVGTQKNNITGFESLEGFEASAWPQGGQASIKSSTEKHSGENSVLLSYDFTATEGPKAAYVKLPASMGTIEQVSKELIVAVKADGQGGGLKANIVDANGVEHSVVFAPNIKQTRWQTLEAQIPAGIPYPIRVTSLYLSQPDATKTIKGTMLLDTLVYLKSVEQANIPESSIQIDPLRQPTDYNGGTSIAFTLEPWGLVKVKGDQGVINSWGILNANSQVVMLRGFSDAYNKGITKPVVAGNVYGLKQIAGADILTVKTTPEGILGGGKDQWPSLKQSIENSQAGTLVIAMGHSPESFSDPMEGQLVIELLSKKAATGTNVFLITGGSQTMGNMVEGIHRISVAGADSSTADRAAGWGVAEILLREGQTPTYDIKTLSQ